jgi:hypothetical protein
MSCNSLTSLPRVCADGIVAGLEKVYVVAHKDLTGTTVYSAATNGTVTQVKLSGSTKFVEVGLLKSTAGLSEKLTKDNTKGTSFYTQTFTLVLGDLSTENKTFIESVQNQPVVVIYKTRTGKYFIVGLNGQFEITNIEGGTGTAEGDQIGHTLTFEGISTSVAPLLDSSILSSLIA